MEYSKYHGLGNDYIMIHPDAVGDDPVGALDSDTVARICRRRFGIGSDGILLGPLPSESADFALKIYNSDGSLAEKSGNGLRIFTRFLWDSGFVTDQPFRVETDGGMVTCQVTDEGKNIRVEMGQVVFSSDAIPMRGPGREVLREELRVGDESVTICAASLGNPHCVVLVDTPDEDEARRLGPLIEHHADFPQRTNVQFMTALDRNNIRIEIWERGSGYTMASGSSSTASAAVARRLGWCDDEITVHMPGGRLQLSFDDAFRATLNGPVARVGTGRIAGDLLEPA